jgi:hypothetical protein
LAGGVIEIIEIIDAPSLPSLLHRHHHVPSRLWRSLFDVECLAHRGLRTAFAAGPQLRRQAGLRDTDGHPEMAGCRGARGLGFWG